MSSAGGVHAPHSGRTEVNRTDGFLRTLPGSWGVVLGGVILTKSAFRGEVLGEAVSFVVVGDMIFAISTCSSWKVGVTLHPTDSLDCGPPLLVSHVATS